MISRNDLSFVLNEIAPLCTQESWDNSGWQVEAENSAIESVMVALEINEDVINEAAEKKADLIVTHHPMFFNPIYSLNAQEGTGKLATLLIKNNISVYSSHTPFDKAERGNNSYLAGKLKLNMYQSLVSKSEDTELIGGMGELPKALELTEFAKYVAKCLGIDKKFIHTVGVAGAKVRIIGLCTGAGCNRENIDAALENGCEAFVTGDVKYHDARYAKDKGLAVIDAGHFGTEYLFAENMAELLGEKIGDRVKIIQSEINLNPWI